MPRLWGGTGGRLEVLHPLRTKCHISRHLTWRRGVGAAAEATFVFGVPDRERQRQRHACCVPLGLQ